MHLVSKKLVMAGNTFMTAVNTLVMVGNTLVMAGNTFVMAGLPEQFWVEPLRPKEAA